MQRDIVGCRFLLQRTTELFEVIAVIPLHNNDDDLAARAGALLGNARVAGSVGEWARAAAVGRFSLEAMTEATRRVYESLGS